MHKIESSVNSEFLKLKPLNTQLRRQGLGNNAINAIDRMVLKIEKDDQWEYFQKLPLIIFGCVVNVLKGNDYLSKKKIVLTINEATMLYNEITTELLDLDDVLKYCKDEADITFVISHEEQFYGNNKPQIKLSGVKTHQQRTISIMEQVKAELDKAIADDPEDDEAHSQLRLYNDLLRRFKKEGIVA